MEDKFDLVNEYLAPCVYPWDLNEDQKEKF